MKKRRWLLITTIILMVMLGAVAIVMRSGWADNYIKERLERELTKILKNDVKLGELSANDRSAHIFDITATLPDDLGTLYVRRLYVRYNLWRFLATGFNIRGVIEHISVEEPELRLNISLTSDNPKPDTASSAPFEIPDLTGYFGQFILKDGSISVVAGDSLLGVAESVRDLQIQVDNHHGTEAYLTADVGTGKLKGEAHLAGGKLTQADASLLGWRPNGVNLAVLDALDLRLDASVRVRGDTLLYAGTIDSIAVDVAGREVRGGIAFQGDMDRVTVQSHNLVADTQPIRLDTIVRKPFDKKRPLDGGLRAEVNVGHYTPDVQGRVRVNVELGGVVSDPRVRAVIAADSIIAGGEVVRDIQARVAWQASGVEFALERAHWRENSFYGKGNWSQRRGLDAFIDCDTLRYSSGDFSVAGYTRAHMQIERGAVRGEAEIMDLSLQAGPLALHGLEARARYGRNRIRVDATDPDERLILGVNASLVDTTATVNMGFRRYPLNVALPGAGDRLPSLSGDITINASLRNIQLGSRLRVFDSRYGLLDGFINTNAALDFAHNRSFLSVSTQHGVYNYEPFKVKLLADGSVDSISTRNFNINNEIDLRVWAQKRESFEWGFEVQAPRVRIARYLAYVMGANEAQQYGGRLDMEVMYNRRGKGVMTARARTDGLEIGDMKGLAMDLSLAGEPQKLNLSRSRILNNGVVVCDLSGSLNALNGEYRVSLVNQKLVLEEVFPDANVKGDLRLQCEAFQRKKTGSGLDVQLEGLNCNFFGFEADTLQVELTQRERLLSVRKLYAMNTRQYRLNASGGIAYNLLTNRAFSDPASMRITFSGDPFRMLSNAFPNLEHGRGKVEIDLRVSIRDEFLSVDQGSIEVPSGRIVIAGQTQRIENMKLKLDIERNIFRIREFQFDMGEGTLFISNDHDDPDKSLVLGILDFGRIGIHTSKSGILVHIPEYTPEKSVMAVRILGRNSDNLMITGPIENLNVIGDVQLSNGRVIFPPNVETLMDFVYGKPKSQKKDSPEEIELPLTFDVRIQVMSHMRYVTRPADFLLKPGSFLHITYDGKMFNVPEAEFVSESGTAEVFGAVFSVDRLQIQINQFNPTPYISGALYKKTADGTLITLSVYPAGEEAPGTWKLELESDDPNDGSMMDILAKLRYNRSRDELTPQQKQSLLQDEALDMAGVEIESALLNPLISPFENYLRRILRLDSFTMRPSVVRNLFSEYAGADDPATEEVDSGGNGDVTLQTGAGLLLNNLSVNLGKYLVRNVYVDYELLVQETTDIETMNLKLNHTFTLRYDLPLRLKLSYKYNIDTVEENTNHEIMLERNFRF